MNLERFSLLLIITFLGYNLSLAQHQSFMPGQALVSLQPGSKPEVLTRRMQAHFAAAPITATKVANLLNIWLLETNLTDDPNTFEWLSRQPEVRAAQYNYKVHNRAVHPVNILPDDPYFPQQWQYVNTGTNGGVPNADLDAELAWNIATGGLTPAGDTIVVAVIDGGIDMSHSDLAPNLWKNRDEIPNDFIDNDNNGYVDDFHGWNVFYGNDNIAGVNTGHGTPVSAIIGAKGNNANGVTGINWNVKIMFVAGGSTQANILSAYDYVLQARRRYNNSNGQTGAFVVAVNCSWGTDYGQPSDAPLWCAAFDSLGHEGILSIAATANNPVNVDEAGDLPTTCTSDYLISVTNLTNADLKAPLAAWGMIHVDLGAYGQGVYSAGAGNSYGSFQGTSFAAPQVSGAIGLLYSAPCANLIAMAKSDPAAAAIWSKNLLLNSAVPNNAMQGITVTGGRLNLFTLLQDYEDQCSPCPPPFALYSTNVSTSSALLKWSEIADFQTVTLHWREKDSGNWQTESDVENSFLLENLSPCTEYEFALSADCWQGISSGWSPLSSFKTDGCCEPPASVWTTEVSTMETTIAWNTVTAANSYRVRVRPAAGSWQIFDASAPAFTIQNLISCTDYEAGVQTLCDTGATAFSSSLFFKTAGCGSCTDAQYCSAESEFATDEWIAAVMIDDWIHVSGNGGDGYQNFITLTEPAPKLKPQIPVDVTIDPGFQSLPYKEYFRIYIDFNMDGDFDDDGELAFAPGWATDNTVTGQITPPLFPNEGLTRMRVMMKYKDSGNLPPAACESFEFGQVEDYCVELSFEGSVPTDNIGQRDDLMRIYPQPATESVWLELPVEADGMWNISVFDLTGRRLTSGVAVSDNGLLRMTTVDWPAGMYVVQSEQGEWILRGRVLKR